MVNTGSSRAPRFLSFERLLEIRELLSKYHVKFKINTVISKLNYREAMSSKIEELSVDRWKIIRMSPYADKNHSNLQLIPEDREYDYFVQENPYAKRVIEENMTNSYLVIDPDGNLLDNSNSGREECDAPYRSVGNFVRENAGEVLKRFLRIFNRGDYQKRYAV